MIEKGNNGRIREFNDAETDYQLRFGCYLLIAAGIKTTTMLRKECGAKDGNSLLRVGLFRKGVTRKQALAPSGFEFAIQRAVKVATE